jgi:protein phosphatase 1G
VESGCLRCVCILVPFHYFSIVDGHGGREVAKFVENWMPKEAQDLLDFSNPEATIANLYNRMDELLREPANKEELASYKTQSSSGEESVSQQSRARTLLQGSIQTDLQELREKKGQVSRDEATQVMMKMMFLRKLEQQMGGGDAESSDSSTDSLQPEQNLADSAGCTAVTVFITPVEYIVANAGDSRAVLCRGSTAIALSEDHKPNDERESARIHRAGGTVEASVGGARTHYRVNGNLNLSRAIGDLEYKANSELKPEEQIITSTPDVVRMERHPDDEFIVLGCDGVWDVLSNEDCVQFIKSRLALGKSLRQISEEVADECLSPDPKATQGIGADNITCIIVDLRTKNIRT